MDGLASLLDGNKTLIAIVVKQLKFAKLHCTTPEILTYEQDLPGVSINFHNLITILGSVFTIFSTLICFLLILGHMRYWTKPKEQKLIVRILAFSPIFSLCALFSVWFYGAASFITPIGQYYEGFAIVSVFLLYINYLTPDEKNRLAFFHDLERRKLFKSSQKKNDQGSLRWYKVR